MSRRPTGDSAGFWGWLGTVVGVVAAAFWIVGGLEAARSGADWADWIGGAVVLTLLAGAAIVRAFSFSGRGPREQGPSGLPPG